MSTREQPSLVSGDEGSCGSIMVPHEADTNAPDDSEHVAFSSVVRWRSRSAAKPVAAVSLMRRSRASSRARGVRFRRWRARSWTCPWRAAGDLAWAWLFYATNCSFARAAADRRSTREVEGPVGDGRAF
jgi:hypothetical protein